MGDNRGGSFSGYGFFPRRLLRQIIGAAWKAAARQGHTIIIANEIKWLG
jgi:hypothetical protein